MPKSNILKLEAHGYCVEVKVSRYAKVQSKPTVFFEMASHYRGAMSEQKARETFNRLSSILERT